MFIDKLFAGIRKFDNPTVAGLDPKLEYIPAVSGKRPSANVERICRCRRSNHKVQ